MRFAATAAAGLILLNSPECLAASKITSWEIGRVVDAEGKQELVGTAEHSSTYVPPPAPQRAHCTTPSKSTPSNPINSCTSRGNAFGPSGRNRRF